MHQYLLDDILINIKLCYLFVTYLLKKDIKLNLKNERNIKHIIEKNCLLKAKELSFTEQMEKNIWTLFKE